MTQQLPIHPHTGLTAIGIGKRGPIWPVRGGDGTGTPPADPPKPSDPANPPVPVEPPKPGDPAPDKPLGPAGERALAAEREARKALEKQVADLAPLAKLAAALGGGDPAKGKTELEALTERQASLEKTLADERAARFRIEVAHEKGLTPEQAAWLTGSTKDELVANADKLLAAFPATPARPGTPAPDPSQGARGGGPAPDLDAKIAEAQKAGKWREVISLQNEKLIKSF